MKLLLSPAKLMDSNNNHSIKNFSTPKFLKKSEELVATLKTYSVSDLQKILGISPKLTQQNWERFQKWQKNPTDKDGIQAIFGYSGEVYRSLNASQLSNQSINYLQNNAFIFSGLYGILKPLDWITPYRLEMKTNLPINKEKKLYSYWGNIITSHIKENSSEKEILLNLTSDEYLKVIDQKKLDRKIVNCKFQTLKNGKPTSIMMHLKAARGLMAKYCAENNIKELEEVKAFNYSNYIFSPKDSNENNLLFIKEM
ncbi:MAG: YaaA family protein [Solirubrobacteraceae bacterium]